MQFENIDLIGFIGDTACGSQETRKQIDEIKKFECMLESEGERLSWDVFDDPDEKRTLFQAILEDRKIRIDQNTPMADRPLFAAITIIDNKAVRLEFYEGHDALQQTYDIRSKELQNIKMPKFLEVDPYAYDPVAFLRETFNIPENISKPVIDFIHDKQRGQYEN